MKTNRLLVILVFCSILCIGSGISHAQSERLVSRSETLTNPEFRSDLELGPNLTSSQTEQSLAPAIESSLLHLQGIALPWQDAELRPATPGVVTEIHVREGQVVEKGTPLVTFDDRIAQAAVEVAKQLAESQAALQRAELVMKSAQSIFIRTETAFRAQAASEFELATKQNEYEQAVAAHEFQLEMQRKAAAEFKLAKAELDSKTLCAPFAGKVVSIPAKIGNTLTVSDVAARVVSDSRLRVDLHLPLELYGQISTEELYQLRAAAPIHQLVPAHVVYVSPVIEPTSGTFRTSFVIDNLDGNLPAGFELRFVSPPSIQ